MYAIQLNDDYLRDDAGEVWPFTDKETAENQAALELFIDPTITCEVVEYQEET